MVNDVARPAARERHVECIEHELGAQMRRHRPADDATAPGVEDDGEEEKAGPGRDVRDVGDPQPVGAVGVEVALDQIGRGTRIAIASGRRDPLAPANPRQPGRTHEPRHPLAADRDAERGQLGVDSRCTVGRA